jgi:hypothetical protein
MISTKRLRSRADSKERRQQFNTNLELSAAFLTGSASAAAEQPTSEARQINRRSP